MISTPAREFYLRPPLIVARDLLGLHLCHRLPDGTVRRGRIVEVEAYAGPEDRASHAKLRRGVPTPRSALMFGPVGVIYVYLIYGMHHCVNVVAHAADGVGAVLIRAIEPAPPLPPAAGAGPARLCAALSIDLSHNGADLLAPAAALQLLDEGTPVPDDRVIASPRIGVDYAGPDAQLPYRLCDRDSPGLSRPATSRSPNAPGGRRRSPC